MNTKPYLNKTIVVTGIEQQLSQTIAQRFGGAGATVVVAGNDAAGGIRALGSLRDSGCTASFELLDARDPAQCGSLVNKVVQQRGGIDVWVNHYALAATASIESMPQSIWDDCISGTLTSTFNCARAAGLAMLAQPDRGVIINLSGVMGMVHAPGYAAVSVANAGVIALTEALGIEWAGRGVRVVGVAHTMMLTKAAGASTAPVNASHNQLKQRTPLRREVTPQDVADTVYYLASTAASYVVAETIRVDGGMLAYQLF